jgi:hypothetical protein
MDRLMFVRARHDRDDPVRSKHHLLPREAQNSPIPHGQLAVPLAVTGQCRPMAVVLEAVGLEDQALRPMGQVHPSQEVVVPDEYLGLKAVQPRVQQYGTQDDSRTLSDRRSAHPTTRRARRLPGPRNATAAAMRSACRTSRCRNAESATDSAVAVPLVRATSSTVRNGDV